jgi:uncharacterized RmlC-like cupin family protein
MATYERVTPDNPNVQVRAVDEGHDHGARYADVVVRRQGERAITPGQTSDMFRDIGVSAETTGSLGIYAAIVSTGPGARSTVHHHRECETAIYILEGRACRGRSRPRPEISSTSRPTRSTRRII